MSTQTLKRLKQRMWVPIDTKPPTKELNAGNPKDIEFKFTRKHFLCFLTLLCGLILAALDYSGIGNIMAQISSDLHATTTQSEWIGNGYALTACVMQLPISTLSDIFGRRNLYMVSLTIFLLGSLLCGSATNMPVLIAGRCIQGAGSSGLLVLPEVILADLIPLRQRGMYYCLLMIAWCVATGCGPLIAGALSQYSSWRWYFYLNLFIGGVSLILSPICIKLKRDNHGNWRQKVGTIDFVGAFLIVGSTTSLLYALSTGGSSNDLPWTSVKVLLPLIVGLLGIVATGLYERYANPKFPMFNYRVFGNTSACLCYLQNVLQGIINMSLTYFLPTFFQGVKGYGELISGVCILPLELVGPPMGILFGLLIERLGHYHFVNLSMWALAILGTSLLTLMNEGRGIAGLLMLQIPVSIGISCLYATLSVTANATNPPYLWTDSTAMMSFCRSVGDSLGTAIGGAIFATKMHEKLSKLQGIPDELSMLSIASVIKSTHDQHLSKEIISALVTTMKTLFVVCAAFAGIGFVSTIVQKEYVLDQKYESKQGIE